MRLSDEHVANRYEPAELVDNPLDYFYTPADRGGDFEWDTASGKRPSLWLHGVASAPSDPRPIDAAAFPTR